MRPLAIAIVLAIFPLFVGPLLAVEMWEPLDRGVPDYAHRSLVRLPVATDANADVVPPAYAASIDAGLPVTDPLPDRHGISDGLGADGLAGYVPASAPMACPAAALCGASTAASITYMSTGCSGCEVFRTAVELPPTVVPEPVAWTLAGLGLASLVFVRRRRRS